MIVFIMLSHIFSPGKIFRTHISKLVWATARYQWTVLGNDVAQFGSVRHGLRFTMAGKVE